MKIIIPGDPIPLARARSSRSGFYDPQLKVKENIRWYVNKHYGPLVPVCGPVWLDVTFYMPIPKSASKKKKKELPGRPHTKKIDLSNCIKMVEDTFNGILWEDDCLIAEIYARKIYAIEGSTVLVITEVQPCNI